jgi:tetrahydromethanopterin S-methyltransferase subunit G
MFSLVQCGKCRTQYNKNSGKKIGAGVIVVYSLVIGVIALAAVVAIRIALN